MLVVLVFSVIVSASARCSFTKGVISAKWQVSDDKLTVEFVNKNIGNNQWTGIGIGPSMADLEVILVKIMNNKPSLVTGFTSNYGPPTLDSNANVVPSLLSLNGNQLRVRFTRPLSSNGMRHHSLKGCQKWHLVQMGNLRNDKIGVHTVKPMPVDVCPEECKMNII
ncbi:hypothetical protein KIN20_005434 [Parelaphostrongylus tenuis]|uniref:DOMON domain-containing protein n=1 Tax=Parelaphostrongylus tenuis TaxID=148309 RepID=A0AAD5QG14_PARTN|nr:hypothetical protein KIN20_005434 [Parelaphostrongylus tenuis]